jgi:hypothetical protein
VSEWDAFACFVDGPEKDLFLGAIGQSAQVAEWGFCRPNEGKEQPHDLSENHVLRFDSTQTHAKRVLVWRLKADDLARSSPNPSTGGGT